MLFYLKVDRDAPEVQEVLTNLSEENKYGNNNKMAGTLRLSIEMEINMVHRYSYPGEKFFCITYNALSVNLLGTLQVCNGCA